MVRSMKAGCFDTPKREECPQWQTVYATMSAFTFPPDWREFFPRPSRPIFEHGLSCPTYHLALARKASLH